MIKAIAIDDEPKALGVIKSHVTKMQNLLLVKTFGDPHKALSFLKQQQIDLIFLDINMPGMSGMEMLKELRLPPKVIFTTAYSEFALESYSFNAIDYLLKPFEFERFRMAVEKAEDYIMNREKTHSFFFIKDGFKSVKLNFEEVLFIQGSGNYLDIHTGEKILSPRMTFPEITSKLPSSQFIRVHQSYIINLIAVDKIENNHIYIGKDKIPVSTSYRDSLMKKLDLV